MEKMDKDSKFPDLFPDLIYTFLLQLSCSHRPETVSPVLKTWRLVHTGTLPEEMNLPGYARESGQTRGVHRVQSSRLRLDLASSCSLEAAGLHKSPLPRGPHCLVLV
jgi:hypothetical protein